MKLELIPRQKWRYSHVVAKYEHLQEILDKHGDKELVTVTESVTTYADDSVQVFYTMFFREPAEPT